MPFEDLTGTVVRKICMACSREFGGDIGNCPHDGNLLVSLPQDQWEGKRLADRYKIERRLGTGGMGIVYLAWHELMERWVAIKMLKQSFVEDQASVKRFQQEAKAASRLKHPNVVTLFDFGCTTTGQPYMVMDYLVGFDAQHPAQSLAQILKESKQISVERCIHIFSQACDALDHAHRQGVIHRDIKPANIMVVPNEEDPDFVKVVDFGIAKLLPMNSIGEGSTETQSLTQVGEICGSPVYMSPEQCLGQPLDSRADIYSMGVVLYEALTGRVPLLGKNMVDTMNKHASEAPPSFKSVRPDLFIPDRVEQVVMRALSKQPHLRQQSMTELAQDLQFSIPRAGQTPNLKTHELVPLLEEPAPAPFPWTYAAAGGAIVAILIAAFFVFAGPKPAPEPKPAVQAQTAPGAQPGATGTGAARAGTAGVAAQAQPNATNSADNSSVPQASSTSSATQATSAPHTSSAMHQSEPVQATPPAVPAKTATSAPPTKQHVHSAAPRKAVVTKAPAPASVAPKSTSSAESRFADLAGMRSRAGRD